MITIDHAAIVRQTEAHVKVLMSGEQSGHDWWHVYRVWRIAIRLSEQESVDRLVVELAALLHDIADWKFHDGDETAGPRAAKEWLESSGVDNDTIEHVCHIVQHLSFKGVAVPTPMRTREGQVVQDADRLDAIGAIGVARAFAYGGYRGRPIFEPEVTPILHSSAGEYFNGTGSTINHIYEKLLLLKGRMNTAAGKALVEERHAFTECFLSQFLREWDGEA